MSTVVDKFVSSVIGQPVDIRSIVSSSHTFKYDVEMTVYDMLTSVQAWIVIVAVVAYALYMSI